MMMLRISPDISRGSAVLNQSAASATAKKTNESADQDEKFLDGVALAEATMQGTNQRFAVAGVEAVDHREVVDAMPQISVVATGVVGFEPADEPQWAKEFFSDIYWQRHSDLRRSKASYSKSISTLVARPAFR